ncbi:MAG: beta-N-acetylhexosaminidase [Tannerellaceae bacterium]|jgi:hexosaminidase|nr:beta-N-acetylhexosaminidase [Tannerellaceae bacterium]
MKKYTTIASYIAMTFAVCACGNLQPDKQAGIIPEPVYLQQTDGLPFSMDEKTPLSYSDISLRELAQQLSGELKTQTGFSLPVDAAPSAFQTKSVYLELTGTAAIPVALPQTYGLSPKDANPADEQYALLISADTLRLTSASVEGLYRGTASLRQLIGARSLPLKLPALQIYDAPRFAWRGLSLDVSRMFFTVPEVKTVIDMLALYKMNVLHLHLSDNEGWRIQINACPQLTETGSEMPNKNRKGGFYTQADYQELVGYAAGRFVTIVPEIDLPGHTSAVFASYPELKNAVPVSNETNKAVISMVALDPDDDAAMLLVKNVLSELASLTPGSYIHIGGDETFGMPEEKYVQFIDKTRDIMRDIRKKTVGWQEISRAHIGAGDIIQHWIAPGMEQILSEDSAIASMIPPEMLKAMVDMFAKAPEDIERGIGKQAKIIVSPARFAYLDFPYKEPSHEPAQEADRLRLGLSFYPGATIEDSWKWNPATFNPLIKETHIAGVEAAIWCETIESLSDLQFLLLPRLSGMAEKGWSSQDTTQDTTGWETYKERLAAQSPIWEKAGWNYFKSSLVDWEK